MIADYKNPDPTYTSSPIQFWRYFADVKNISNMYPYGKSYGTNAIYNASEDYRYGFNGMEKEKNMDASGDITDFGARVFDANFPMFLSPDKFESNFPFYSPYNHAVGDPINVIDEDGNIWKLVNQMYHNDQDYAKAVITKMFSNKIKVDITNDIVSLEFTSGNSENTLDENQLKLYKTMNNVIEKRYTTRHEIFIDDPDLNIGAYQNSSAPGRLGAIDFGDLDKFFENSVTKNFSLGFIGHEVEEQWYRMAQLFLNGRGDDYETDHGEGKNKEGDINGYDRLMYVYNGELSKNGPSVINGMTKLVVNEGGGTGIFSVILRFFGIGEEPKIITLETTFKDGKMSGAEIKEGNTIDFDKGDKFFK